MKKENIPKRREKAQQGKKVCQALAVAAVFLFFLLYAVYQQLYQSQMTAEGSIDRPPAGGSEKRLQLYLTAEDLPEDYVYELTVEPARITKRAAQALFAQAEEEIEGSIFADGDNADHVTKSLTLSDSYAEGLVTADWFFEDGSYVTADGTIREEALAEPVILTASVQMLCGEFYQLYQFPLQLLPRRKGPGEELLTRIGENLRLQYESGAAKLLLPKEAAGKEIAWREKKEPYILRMLFLEITAAGLLYLTIGEREKEARREHIKAMEREYPEVVSRLAVLMGAGCSLKSAFEKVALRYQAERSQGMVEEKPLYEEMILTWREMEEGESERFAYRKFGERCDCPCCLRLSRLFLQNLQKGNSRLCELLLAEADHAFEERKLSARQAGEEAGTRLLMPLLLMMIVVMAIVMMPALLSFHM